MNDFLEENKKTIIIIGVLVGLTIIMSIASLFIGNKEKLPTPEESLKELSEIYYEDIFYPNISKDHPESFKSYLEQQNDGMKVTLLDILSSIPAAKQEIFFREEDGVSCDLYETYVMFTPLKPYGVSNYDVKIVTDCEPKSFEDEENISGESGVENE